jgi:hypothetical protein
VSQYDGGVVGCGLCPQFSAIPHFQCPSSWNGNFLSFLSVRTNMFLFREFGCLDGSARLVTLKIGDTQPSLSATRPSNSARRGDPCWLACYLSPIWVATHVPPWNTDLAAAHHHHHACWPTHIATAVKTGCCEMKIWNATK